MAEAIGAAAGAGAAAEALGPVIQQGLEMANTELFGYHKTVYKYDQKGQLKESHTWTASLKAWELAGLLAVFGLYEVGMTAAHAISNDISALENIFNPKGIEEWVQQSLTNFTKGLPTLPPMARTFMQGLTSQGLLTLHSLAQTWQPLITSLSSNVAKSALDQLSRTAVAGETKVADFFKNLGL